MKYIFEVIIKIKMLATIIFVGELALFMISKSFLGVYEVSFLTIISLFILAIIISTIKMFLENENLKRNTALCIQYLLICLTVFIMNALFKYYDIVGVQYLYLLLFVTFSYLGGLVGFYIVSKYEVTILNLKLKDYLNQKSH